jgi:hypothetical protein
MAGTARVDLVQGIEGLSCSESKANALVDMPKISKAITFAATGTITQALVIPAGAYVYRVGVLATTAVASGDFNVGDGVATTRYLNGITTMRQYDIIMGQTTGAVTCDMVGGHYYAAEDTIDVQVVATATTGTVKVLVWYTFLT